MDYSSRIFLNKKEGMAAMITSFSQTGSYVDSSVTLSDCHRQISLDFNSYTTKEYNVKFNKLDAIIQQLVALRNHMEEFKASPEFKRLKT